MPVAHLFLAASPPDAVAPWYSAVLALLVFLILLFLGFNLGGSQETHERDERHGDAGAADPAGTIDTAAAPSDTPTPGAAADAVSG